MRLDRRNLRNVSARSRATPVVSRAGRHLALVMLATTAPMVLAASAASAQSWWPFSQQDPPRPKAPVYQSPPAPIPPNATLPPGQLPGQRPQYSSNPICTQLEQRLVAETQRGSQTQNQLPRIDEDTRQTERAAAQSQATLDRGDCYDYFLFAKTLRRTQQCVLAANQLDAAKRHLSDLSIQRQQMQSTTGRSYQDDIIRELARNNCGSNWTQEARKRDTFGSSIFGSADPEEDGAAKSDNAFGSLPFATYRTVCVRLCDGFFFPVSFSTLPNHFGHDADQCQAHCAAPVDLYYYQNPGSDIRRAMSVKSQAPYTNLKTAFRYTKEYVQGCSCKDAEYVPAASDKKAELPIGGGATRQAAKLP